jgi:hypothetical protein
MVKVIASTVVDRGFKTGLGKAKDYENNVVASPLSMQH